MTDGASLRVTADAVTVATAAGDRVADGPIEAQGDDWWAGLRRDCAALAAIPVVLDAPDSLAVRLPHWPRTRRETERLVDRVAPIRWRYLSVAPPRRAADGDVTVTIVHADRLRSIREMFAAKAMPPPRFLAPDGGAFDEAQAPPDAAMRTTAIVVFAALLAIPILCSAGAALLAVRIAGEVAALDRAEQAEGDARRGFRDLAAAPTVAARIAAVARRLPGEATIAAIGDAGARRVTIIVDATDPDALRVAMRRAGTLSGLREDRRSRTREGYRVTYSGVAR